jgi:lipopolysaccharide transport system permease protein
MLNLWKKRTLIRELTVRELQQRYRGSFLGGLWTFIVPLIMLFIYTFVFSYIFRARWQAGGPESPPGEFALILFAGLTPFNIFSEVANRSPQLVVNVPNYVKKVVFPLEVLPVVAVNVAVINSLVNIGLLVIGSLVVYHKVSPILYFLPLVYVPVILLCLGVGWLLASLGVYIRDIAQGIGLVVQIILFTSPVFYSIDFVPAFIKPVYVLNPLTFIITSFRKVLLWGETISMLEWLMWSAALFIFAWLGLFWFVRTKRGFADVL